MEYYAPYGRLQACVPEEEYRAGRMWGLRDAEARLGLCSPGPNVCRLWIDGYLDGLCIGYLALDQAKGLRS